MDGLLLHESRRRERLNSLAFGIAAAVLWPAAVMLATRGAGQVPIACFWGVFALGVTYTAIMGWFTQPALLVSPSRLLTGRVWVGKRSWVRSPAQVAAVQLTNRSAGDGARIVTFSLVLTTHAVRPLFRLPDSQVEDCRAFGQWLAAEAGIRWTDGARVPRNRRRLGGRNFYID